MSKRDAISEFLGGIVLVALLVGAVIGVTWIVVSILEMQTRQPPPITITEQNGRICLENTETGSVACLITVERE